jgi:predicted nuclease with TOPRIM domain
MLPGFRDVEEARRKAEEALAESLQERVRLENHVRQLEAELTQARQRLSMADAQ